MILRLAPTLTFYYKNPAFIGARGLILWSCWGFARWGFSSVSSTLGSTATSVHEWIKLGNDSLSTPNGTTTLIASALVALALMPPLLAVRGLTTLGWYFTRLAGKFEYNGNVRDATYLAGPLERGHLAVPTGSGPRPEATPESREDPAAPGPGSLGSPQGNPGRTSTSAPVTGSTVAGGFDAPEPSWGTQCAGRPDGRHACVTQVGRPGHPDHNEYLKGITTTASGGQTHESAPPASQTLQPGSPGSRVQDTSADPARDLDVHSPSLAGPFTAIHWVADNPHAYDWSLVEGAFSNYESPPPLDVFLCYEEELLHPPVSVDSMSARPEMGYSTPSRREDVPGVFRDEDRYQNLRRKRSEFKQQERYLSEDEKHMDLSSLHRKWKDEAQLRANLKRETQPSDFDELGPLAPEMTAWTKAAIRRVIWSRKQERWLERMRKLGVPVHTCDVCSRQVTAQHRCVPTGLVVPGAADTP
ncbi:MAG: hypothetical protein KVP17_004080, partial [Porospora cf. gigantea B]|uniref:uncharacterized protein n=1 Tax=Porospora cf. gigantea B TaxID=2853592 RepID=UPI003571B4CE